MSHGVQAQPRVGPCDMSHASEAGPCDMSHASEAGPCDMSHASEAGLAHHVTCHMLQMFVMSWIHKEHVNQLEGEGQSQNHTIYTLV